MYSLWQDLLCCTIIFDPVTLTLEFDLLLKNFNHGHSFLTGRVRTFILHICVHCDKTFYVVPSFLTSDLDLGAWPSFQKFTDKSKLNWPWYFWIRIVIWYLQNRIVVDIYIWLPPASYVVFLTTLVTLTFDLFTKQLIWVICSNPLWNKRPKWAYIAHLSTISKQAMCFCDF